MFINRIDDKFAFGKYKKIKISEIAIRDPNYISWCLSNIDNFLIHPDFIKRAVMINNNFWIAGVSLVVLEEKIRLANKILKEEHENLAIGIPGDFEYKFDFSYKEWLDENKRPFLIEQERKKKLEEIEKNRLEKEAIEEYAIERAERQSLNKDLCDWSLYNDDTDYDQQNDNFWNQF
jgi:hypothetical protein